MKCPYCNKELSDHGLGPMSPFEERVHEQVKKLMSGPCHDGRRMSVQKIKDLVELARLQLRLLDHTKATRPEVFFEGV